MGLKQFPVETDGQRLGMHSQPPDPPKVSTLLDPISLHRESLGSPSVPLRGGFSICSYPNLNKVLREPGFKTAQNPSKMKVLGNHWNQLRKS